MEIPSDASKVELAVILTGHGFGGTYNCAEFCNHKHHFLVNGTDNLIDHPEADINDGCMQDVMYGTVPNQYGTWWYGRAGWCPGQRVPVRTVDITDQVTLGETNTIAYEAYDPNGNPHTGGGDYVSIDLDSWLIISR